MVDYDEWLVVFTKVDVPYFYTRFVHKDFQHVKIAKKSLGEQFIILIEPTQSSTKTEIFANTQENIEEFIGDGIYLNVVTKIPESNRRNHFCYMNCVEVVKSYLGMKKPFIFTPYQLYKELKHG